MTVTTDLLDRIHVINQTISYSQLTCYRYFPAASGKVPFIVPLLASATHAPLGSMQGGDSVDWTTTRNVTLLCAVGSPKTDIALETAHKHTEQIIDAVLQAYANAPYLETLALGELNSIFDTVLITADTGVVFNNTTGLFEIRFTLNVPMIRNL